MAKAAFIGLGVMGFPMAGHLVKAGHTVTVYNRTKTKAEDWVKAYGGTLAATPAEAAHGADFVMSCVGNDDDLRAVVLGENGALKGMAKGAIYIDHTTVSAKVSRELAAVAAKWGIGYLDAPVSGGQAGAEEGQLSIMCGGSAEDYAKAEPAMRAYAKAVRLMGPVGAGQLTKMCNQIAIAGVIEGLAESLHFAEKAGLSIPDVVEAISKGAAGSWQMSNRSGTMAKNEYDFGFAIDWMRKDLGICLRAAEETGASLPVTALIDQFYKDVQNMGGNRWDTSALIARLRKLD